eukprot:TRINITY_DN49683_c0_g1_i1.p1 TRINITY_DN49683_c0_g1~~TRINITY_DN49683_c0_g1_i1.p1  ORF type:complete len:804 (+),score=157.94 TRINITY_DN49683_c0_g1_i1:22-2412(+)
MSDRSWSDANRHSESPAKPSLASRVQQRAEYFGRLSSLQDEVNTAEKEKVAIQLDQQPGPCRFLTESPPWSSPEVPTWTEEAASRPIAQQSVEVSPSPGLRVPALGVPGLQEPVSFAASREANSLLDHQHLQREDLASQPVEHMGLVASSTPRQDFCTDLPRLLTSDEALQLALQKCQQDPPEVSDDLDSEPFEDLRSLVPSLSISRAPSASTLSCLQGVSDGKAYEGKFDPGRLGEDELLELRGLLSDNDRSEVFHPSVLQARQTEHGSGVVGGYAARHRQRGAALSNLAAPGSHVSRGKVWELQKHQRLERLKRVQEAKELRECSFQPKLQTQSARGKPSIVLDKNKSDALATRLCRSLPSEPQRAIRAAKEKRSAEERQLQECTFKPNVNSSSGSRQLKLSTLSADRAELQEDCFSEDGAPCGGVQSQETRSRSISKERENTEAGTAMFGHPHTNEVPAHMVHARQYVSQNVFSRLSQPSCRSTSAADEAGGAAVEPGEDTCGGGLKDDAVVRGDGSAEEAMRSEASIASFKEGEDRNPGRYQSFLGFLQRQNDREESRRQHLHELEVSSAPSLTPQLCDTSRRLVERQRRRVSVEARSASPDQRFSPSRSALTNLQPWQRLHTSSAGVLQGTPQADTSSCQGQEGHSFRPTIHPFSARRPSRGVHELSSGDLHRREVRRSELREQILAEERRQETFAPQLRSGPRVQGRLRLRQEPHLYTARLADERQAILAHRERELQSRIDQALAECTFCPKVNPGAPSYVRRLAEAHRELREARAQEEGSKEQQRPDWR